MEAIAADLAKDSVQSLLKAIVGSIGKEIALAWGFKDDLKDLQKKLTRLNYLLSGAESKFGSGSPEFENPVLRDWVKKVADVAYRAEDVVDEYAYEVLNRKLALRDMASMQPLLRFKTRVRFFCFSPSSNPVLLRFRMAHKVKSLKESIADVYADAEDLGIKPVEVAATSSSSTAHPTEIEMALQLQREQVDNYEVLVGRNHIKAQIIQQLQQASNSPKRITVIGIHGMPGVGKTKLCHSAFETTTVEGYFKERIWICVSHDFDSLQLLKGMIEQLGEASTMSNIEAIKGKLQQKLEGKKYLLVLDDVWDTFVKAWEPLRNCLQDVGELKGNTILVTSRSKKVLASLKAHSSDPTGPMDDPYIHELPGLLEPDSWSLFEQKVGKDLLDSTDKEELARKMLTKCGGVPLAIKTLAGLLRSRNGMHQWKEIEASSIWKEDAITLPASVKLSFKYLPSVALKKCFVYCAIFHEDEIIQKDKLIRLWMAQGFLQDPDDEMEEVGEDYFQFLLNNSLFQDAEFNDLGHVISCKMHDAVRALALMLSGNDVTQEVQHLSISLSKSGDVGSMFKLGAKLRTFSVFFIPLEFENFTLKTVKNLRVLNLGCMGREELLDSIGELRHLRYLDVSNNHIESLPNGFTRLYNLQTFILFSPNHGRFPMLPKGFSKLVKLRHLIGWDNFGIQVGLGMLTCLRTLPPIYAGAGSGGGLSELQFLSKLEGSLTINGLEAVEIEEAEKVNLGKKENIKDLRLGWGRNYNAETKTMAVAEALQPHSNLASLHISGYNAKAFPQWVTKMMGYDGFSLVHLRRVAISNCTNMTCLPIGLSNLQRLESLDLGPFSPDLEVFPFPTFESLVKLFLDGAGMEKVKNLPNQIQHLSQLRLLFIEGFDGLESLPEWLGNLTSLHDLALWELPNVKCLPSEAAMARLSQLTSLNIHSCPLLKDACDKEIGTEWSKIQHIPNVKIS